MLQRIGDDGRGIVEVIKDLLTKAITKHRMRCWHVSVKYVVNVSPIFEG